MSTNTYHSCAVRECRNSSIKTPGKLWIKVPSVDIEMRKIWLNLARRDPNSLSPKSPLYFCEDHFDLENDMENYMQYKIMGTVRTVRLKPKCVPSKFDCQVNPKAKSSKTRRKRQRMSNIQEIDNQDLRNIVNKADKGVQVVPEQEHKAVQINLKLPNDMENYMEYRVMGSVPRIRMKPGCIPTKFYCQSYVVVKQGKISEEECEDDVDDISLTTKDEEFGKPSFGSSALNTKMENMTQQEAHKTPDKKNVTKSILMHKTDKLRSNANQTKLLLENQMTTLQPKLSVSTSSIKVKMCVTSEPLQRTSWITGSGVISKAATAGLSDSSDADSNGAIKPGTSSKKKNQKPKQSSSGRKEIKVFCPECKAEVSHTVEGILEDQAKALIAKVFHYFEEELELLKQMTAKLKLSHLSKFRYRTAQATGVSEAAVFEILQEEARWKAAKQYEQPRNADTQQEDAKNAEIFHEPPEKRHRPRKNPSQTKSSNEDTDDSDTQLSVLQEIKIEPETQEWSVKEEPVEYYNEEPEVNIEPSNVKGVNNESTKASTTDVQTITSRIKTNAQKCREYRERKKLQNTMVQNITAERSGECSETDQLQAKKPKTNAERRKKHYEKQKLKKQGSKKIPKTVKQRNKEYYDRKKKKQALNTLNHHSDAKKIVPESQERLVKEEPVEYYNEEPEINIEPSNVKGSNNEQAQIDPISTVVKVEPTNDEVYERERKEEESSSAEAPSYCQLSKELHVENNKKKERQQRYREKNREKLKQREADRRKRIQYLQNIAVPTSSNINTIDINDEEVIDAYSENSTQATQDIGDIETEINYDPGTSNSSPNIPVRVDNKNAERNRLYRERHREIINQRRRDNWQRKRELEQIQTPIQKDNDIEEISCTQRQQQYQERDGEEIKECQTDSRLPQKPIAASNAERNRSYRERNRERINEQRRLKRLRKILQRVHTESNRSSLMEIGQVKVEKIDIEEEGFS